jgi:GLPGLI family protein
MKSNKSLPFIAALYFALLSMTSSAQLVKQIGDCTVSYTLTGSDPSFANTTKTFYLKGKKTRIDIISSSYSQSTIYDAGTGNAVILKELGGNKYLYNFNATQWSAKNKEFDGAQIISSEETKNILGYECKKATLTFVSGAKTIVWYAPGIIPSVSESSFQFKLVPGFVLEYESSTTNGQKMKYTANMINFNPVAAALFEIPKTGYRVMPV